MMARSRARRVFSVLRKDSILFQSAQGKRQTVFNQSMKTKAKLRQAAVAAFCLLLLASCGGRKLNQEFDPFVGMVVADEPQAAEAGRAAIAAGGNAVDAAVAMYFTLSATLPSRASLGSGGVCTVFSPERKGAETLLFLPNAGSSGGVVPLGMRAMAALSARYGRLPWGLLLADAEQRARFGATVGEQLAADLQSAEAASSDLEFQRLFAPNGRRLSAGDQLVQPALAELLSQLRSFGPNYSHSSDFSENFQRATQQAGLTVTANEMRDLAPNYVPAVEVYLGGPTAYFSPPPAANGLLGAQLLNLLTDQEDFSDLEPLEAAHLFAEASAFALSLIHI